MVEPVRERAFTITLSYACYTILVRDGVVVSAPPIARWMVGKGGSEIAAFVAHKGGKIEELD